MNDFFLFYLFLNICLLVYEHDFDVEDLAIFVEKLFEKARNGLICNVAANDYMTEFKKKKRRKFNWFYLYVFEGTLL